MSSAVADWGVQPVALRLSAAGCMLDFRFRVLDAEKAGPFMTRSQKPCLIHQATAARLYVPAPPKIGSVRQVVTGSDKNRVYFMMFGNPSRFVKSGDAVTLEIGDCRITDLVVQ